VPVNAQTRLLSLLCPYHTPKERCPCGARTRAESQSLTSSGCPPKQVARKGLSKDVLTFCGSGLGDPFSASIAHGLDVRAEPTVNDSRKVLYCPALPHVN
jgi:hypothetical protein